MSATMPDYREPLPSKCPPAEAKEPAPPVVIYRALRTATPTEADFTSQQALQPTRAFEGVSPCQARGLSVYTDIADAARLLGRHSNFRKGSIGKIQVGIGCGPLQQTGAPSHHTWWPLASFDVTANCEVARP